LGLVICMQPARALYRRLPLLALLLALAFLRAEQGVAELQGREGEPSRILRLVPDETGEGWRFALAGLEGWIPTKYVLLRSDGPLLAREALVNWMKQALP
jgi:hypothetical protein